MKGDTKVKNTIKEILQNTNYKYYGIRGIDYTEVAIGKTLETSYDWDMDRDESTYGTGEEEELGGVSVTIVRKDMKNSTAPYWTFEDEFESEEDKIQGILNAIDWHGGYYSYKNVYLVGSDEQGYGDPNDENEYILKDAKVLLKVK